MNRLLKFGLVVIFWIFLIQSTLSYAQDNQYNFTDSLFCKKAMIITRSLGETAYKLVSEGKINSYSFSKEGTFDNSAAGYPIRAWGSGSDENGKPIPLPADSISGLQVVYSTVSNREKSTFTPIGLHFLYRSFIGSTQLFGIKINELQKHLSKNQGYLLDYFVTNAMNIKINSNTEDKPKDSVYHLGAGVQITVKSESVTQNAIDYKKPHFYYCSLDYSTLTSYFNLWFTTFSNLDLYADTLMPMKVKDFPEIKQLRHFSKCKDSALVEVNQDQPYDQTIIIKGDTMFLTKRAIPCRIGGFTRFTVVRGPNQQLVFPVYSVLNSSRKLYEVSISLRDLDKFHKILNPGSFLNAITTP